MANKFIIINNKQAVLNGAWLLENPGLRELTLSTDGNGTLTATKTIGYPNETSLLTPTPNNLYVFDRYELSGAGSIQNNTYTFGYENASIKAYFKDSDEVKIGNQTWKRYNLAINDGGGGIYTRNVTVNGHNLGTQYYYTRTAAIRVANTIAGWHVPSMEEWNTLRDYAGGSNNAGKKLKSTFAWNSNGNGTDDFGFRALPCGSYNYEQNVWSYLGERARLVSTTRGFGTYMCSVYYNNNSFGYDDVGTIAAPVRLIKD